MKLNYQLSILLIKNKYIKCKQEKITCSVKNESDSHVRVGEQIPWRHKPADVIFKLL